VAGSSLAGLKKLVRGKWDSFVSRSVTKKRKSFITLAPACQSPPRLQVNEINV